MIEEGVFVSFGEKGYMVLLPEFLLKANIFYSSLLENDGLWIGFRLRKKPSKPSTLSWG